MSLNQHFLAQCESEQLHLSGAIQPHGTLLVADAVGVITHAAENIHLFLEQTADTWIGKILPNSFTPLIAKLGYRPGDRQVGVVDMALAQGRYWLDAVVTRGEVDQLVIEILDRHHSLPPPQWPRVLPPDLVPDDEEGMQTLRRKLTEQIADLTGFQRVMYYQFRDDGDGDVIAEARRSDVYGSYLGLRYPASDIPQIARTLYLKNPWRLIPDITASPISLLSQTTAVPDLTYSDLRSVSPVHLSYLANMGVKASLSFPVNLGGELTALVAAHHSDSRFLPIGVLEQASALVRNHILTLQRYHAQVTLKAVDQPMRRFQALPIATPTKQILANWQTIADWLMKEFHADGAQLCLGDEHRQAGKCGRTGTLTTLEQWFFSVRNESTVNHTDCLSHHMGSEIDDQVAGVLALRANTASQGELRLYLTRQEYLHEVAWGGNPDKPIEYTDGTNAMSPRRSFDKWLEKRRGYCRSWSRMDRLLALSLRQLLNHDRSLL